MNLLLYITCGGLENRFYGRMDPQHPSICKKLALTSPASAVARNSSLADSGHRIVDITCGVFFLLS
jgi:hypothetical protein